MSTIKMGNDEFILYIRKWNKSCNITNEKLGKDIWFWIKEHDLNAKQIIEDMPCLWDKQGLHVDAQLLPKTATQFEFDRKLLPSLYDYLDLLAR